MSINSGSIFGPVNSGSLLGSVLFIPEFIFAHSLPNNLCNLRNLRITFSPLHSMHPNDSKYSARDLGTPESQKVPPSDSPDIQTTAFLFLQHSSQGALHKTPAPYH